jgi:shikimate kinase
MFVLLVGPKGSGKSHIGRLLERRRGVHFFHVEPLWMRYYADCRAAGREPVIAEGIGRVHPEIVAALSAHPHVSVETTGASPEILSDLLTLRPPADTLVVRVDAPLDLCLERIAARDQTNQIPMDVESIRRVYELGRTAVPDAALTIRNVALGDDAILAAFAHRL